MAKSTLPQKTSVANRQDGLVVLPVADSSDQSRSAGSADEFFAALVREVTHGRKRNNLIAVKRALDLMRETKAPAYTVAAVARTLSALKLNSPKEQSIRNAEGKAYRDLINAFAEENTQPPKRKSTLEDDDLAAAIPDHRIAARVRLILNENKSLRRRLDISHAQYKKLAPLNVSDGEFLRQPQRVDNQFSDMEVRAVLKFVTSMKEFDLYFDAETGALLWGVHRVEVAPPGLQQALKKIIESKGGEA